MQRFLIGFVLADFAALNVYAVAQHGLLGIFELALANSATVLVLTDLVIALSLVMIWMARDARQRGVTSAPYLALTLALGSVGPLLYLLLRREQPMTVAPTPIPARA